MDIHRPKAAHSIREFLIEIGTIICGILIALGLEQVVEVIHRNEQAGEAREALRTELGQDKQRFTLMIEANNCAERQISAYFDWAKGGPKPPPFRTFRPLIRVTTWETVKLGAVPLMPLKERTEIAGVYDQLLNVVHNIDRNASASEVLADFDALPVLKVEQRDQLLKAAAAAQRSIHHTSGTAARLVEAIGAYVGTDTNSPALPAVIRPGVDWACGRSASNPFDQQR
jgi:hypothetical protein